MPRRRETNDERLDDAEASRALDSMRGMCGKPLPDMSREELIREWERRVDHARTLRKRPETPRQGLLNRARFKALVKALPTDRADVQAEIDLIKSKVLKPRKSVEG